jgi:shikimate 5-dehydrogenase/shikimate kinase
MNGSIYAVIGRPVLQSKSPELFHAAFKAAGISDATYLRLAAKSAEEALLVARQLELEGLNVTAPFKEEMFSLTKASEPSRTVNTVRLPGREAVSTDSMGVVGALGFDLRGKSALVIGAGGSARAAISGLIAAGARVTVTNRTVPKAARLAADFNCDVWEPAAVVADSFDVIVNTVPELLFPLDRLPSSLKALDAIYHYDTPFSRAVKSSGASLIPGSEWLLHQGIGAIEFLTGLSVSPDSLRTALSQNRTRPKRINLIGMMGSGKSTVGPLLAEQLGFRFIEQDRLVEERAGATIREIVLEQGESTFRKLERELLAEFSGDTDIVVATGGGVVKYCPEHLAGLNIWLHVALDELARRLRGRSDRPLLNGGDISENLERIWQERRFLYARCSDLVIPEDRPENIVRRICEEISQTWKS